MKKSILLVWFLSACSFAQGLQVKPGTLLEPHLGEQLEGASLPSFGTLQIRPTGAVHQLLAGDKVVGYVISAGTYAVQVTDTYSKEVTRRNLKTVPRSKLSGVLLSAAVWTSPPDQIQEATSDQGNLEWATDLLDSAQFTTPVISMTDAFENGTPGAVYALLRVKDKFGDQYYVYHRDPLKRRETLWFLDQYTQNTGVSALKGAMIPHMILKQPTEGTWWDNQPAPLVSVAEDIHIDNDQGDHVTIRTETKLQATQLTHTWRAGLMTNVWTNRNLPRMNHVKEVQVNGQPVSYVHHHHELLVRLDRAYQPGESLTITTVTEGDIAVRLNGNQYWVFGTSPWYPRSPLNGQLSKITITVRCPKKLQPFASGDRVDFKEEGDHVVLKTHYDRPTQFPVAAAGDWSLFTKEENGFICNVGTYGMKRKKAAEKLTRAFFNGVAYYEQIFGAPYPFKELTILEHNVWGFGQAPAGILLLSKEAFGSQFQYGYDFFAHGVSERFAHEIAHAWWGHVVRMDSMEEQWISEGFATYSAALLLAAAKGKQGPTLFKKTARHWQFNASRIELGSSLYLANTFADYSDVDANDRLYLLYNKAPLVIHAIRLKLKEDHGEQMGERIFFGTVQQFLKGSPNSWASTKQFIGLLNHYTKSDWQPWFEKYVYGTEMPELRIR